MSSKEALAKNMRALRLAKGWSQEELAHRSGLDRTYISSLERQGYTASLATLDKLADALEVSSIVLITVSREQ
jgi:transcriptional regulator with XRE-family HTH domain